MPAMVMNSRASWRSSFVGFVVAGADLVGGGWRANADVATPAEQVSTTIWTRHWTGRRIEKLYRPTGSVSIGPSKSSPLGGGKERGRGFCGSFFGSRTGAEADGCAVAEADDDGRGGGVDDTVTVGCGCEDVGATRLEAVVLGVEVGRWLERFGGLSA
jgi:hypothetical protein